MIFHVDFFKSHFGPKCRLVSRALISWIAVLYSSMRYLYALIEMNEISRRIQYFFQHWNSSVAPKVFATHLWIVASAGLAWGQIKGGTTESCTIILIIIIGCSFCRALALLVQYTLKDLRFRAFPVFFSQVRWLVPVLRTCPYTAVCFQILCRNIL